MDLNDLRQNLKLFPILIQYRISTTINIDDYYWLILTFALSRTKGVSE